jgi:hypothetical protein
MTRLEKFERWGVSALQEWELSCLASDLNLDGRHGEERECREEEDRRMRARWAKAGGHSFIILGEYKGA